MDTRKPLVDFTKRVQEFLLIDGYRHNTSAIEMGIMKTGRDYKAVNVKDLPKGYTPRCISLTSSMQETRESADKAAQQGKFDLFEDFIAEYIVMDYELHLFYAREEPYEHIPIRPEPQVK